MIDKTAGALVEMGVKKGDRVAIHMDNCPQFVIAYFGTQSAGGVVDTGIERFLGAISVVRLFLPELVL